MTIAGATRCAGRLWDNFRGYRPCPHTGKYQEDGKRWCGTHAPSKIQARRGKADASREERADAWNEKYRRPNEQERRAALCIVACAGIPDAALAAGVVQMALDLARDSAANPEWDNNGYCWWCGRQNYLGQGEHTDDCQPAKIRRLLGAGKEE